MTAPNLSISAYSFQPIPMHMISFWKSLFGSQYHTNIGISGFRTVSGNVITLEITNQSIKLFCKSAAATTFEYTIDSATINFLISIFKYINVYMSNKSE